MPRLANDGRFVGTAGYVTYEDPDNPTEAAPVKIPVTLWSAKIMKSFQSTTNSQNYDPDSGLLYPTRVQTSMSVEGAIQGRFRLDVIPVTLLTAMYLGDTTPIITLYFSGDDEFGNGFFHLSEFETANPCDGVVDFQARIASNGMFLANVAPRLLPSYPEPPVDPGDPFAPIPSPPDWDDDQWL